MKLAKVKFPNFLNFKKNFELDLTYPKGHEKAGCPLDKICIIGQSGTGKTVLLKLIRHFILSDLIPYDFELSKYLNKDIKLNFKIDETSFTKTLDENTTEISENGTAEGNVESNALYNAHISDKNKILLIYYPYNVLSKWRNKDEIVSDLEKVEMQNSEKKGFDFNVSRISNIVDFEFNDINLYWNPMDVLIKEYNSKRNKLKVNFFDDLLEDSGKLEVKKSEFMKWEKDNRNPLIDLAENYLDPLLKHFNLEVSKINDYKDGEFIKIQQRDGTIIPINFLSSGTKHIIFTTFPLFVFKPKYGIILFDEPERSLYPDMQVKHLENIINFSQGAQIIIASHSPTIASIFEPWEVIDLEFDTEGKVYRKLYYDIEKENHISNYTLFPNYLKYDQILQKVFDVNYEARDNVRAEGITEFSRLKKELEVLKNDNKEETDQYKQLFKKFENLGTMLSWNSK